MKVRVKMIFCTTTGNHLSGVTNKEEIINSLTVKIVKVCDVNLCLYIVVAVSVCSSRAASTICKLKT